jgi:hypothetical protein
MHRAVITTLLASAALAAAGLVAAAPVAGAGTWETTLQARDLDGDGGADAYYDTTLDISWLADAAFVGQVSFDDAAAWAGSQNVDPWSGQTATNEARRYSFHAGRQVNLDKSSLLFAWAVHDGDVGPVATVPEPQTYALMLAGLFMMIPLARRRRRDAF